MRLHLIPMLMSALCATAADGATEERVELEETAIIGNKEMPNVRYVIPWRKAEIMEVAPIAKIRWEEDLMPLDQEVFQRRIDYIRQLGNAFE